MIRERGKTMAMLAVILCLSATPTFADYSYEETVTKNIDLKGASRVVLQSMRGDISVIGVEGREDIEIEIHKVASAKDEAALKEYISKMGIVVTRPEGSVKIETHFPKQGDVSRSILSFFLGKDMGMSIELDVLVPREIAVDLATASGDIRVEGISGDVSVSTASGDIKVNDIEGEVTVAVASGSISLSDITGDVHIDSASGDIVAKNIGGGAAVSTAIGDTELTDIGGSLEMRSHMGDVTVYGVGDVKYEGVSGEAKFIDVRGGVNASAASGDLIFRVVPDKTTDYSITTSSGDVMLRFMTILEDGYILRASTTTGEISAQLPISIKKVDRNIIIGVVRNGLSKVLIETASGDISVEEPEE
jgi:DUF4097 and DUF4098 domain-containing protein YvlB